MRLKTVLTLMPFAFCAGASSCANRVETHLTFPSAADLKVEAEPTYPVAALERCPTKLRSDPCPAEEAERAWWNDMLIWGRAGWAQNARVCRWALDLGKQLPAGWCGEKGTDNEQR